MGSVFAGQSSVLLHQFHSWQGLFSSSPPGMRWTRVLQFGCLAKATAVIGVFLPLQPLAEKTVVRSTLGRADISLLSVDSSLAKSFGTDNLKSEVQNSLDPETPQKDTKGQPAVPDWSEIEKDYEGQAKNKFPPIELPLSGEAQVTTPENPRAALCCP